MADVSGGLRGRRPRLLCIYQHAPTPGAPGIYRHRLYLAELVRRGWDVDLVSTAINYMTGTVPARYTHRPYVREELDGVQVHWVWASRGIHASRVRRALNYATFATSAALRAATLPRPDVVLASSPPLPVAALGTLLSRRFRRPWLLEVRDIWPESAASVGWLDPESAPYRLLERLAHGVTRDAGAVIVPTPGLSDGVRAHGAARVEVVPGAVFDAPADPAERAELRRRLQVPDGACLFLYLGAIGVANGLDLLLDAVARLPWRTPAVFALVGDGSDRRRLEQRVAAERITRVRIVGPVGKEEAGAYLAASDVCLHLLRPDPVFEAALPSKVLEYFGAHRPFITTVAGLPRRLALESGGGFATTSAELTEELERWCTLTSDELRACGERSFTYGSANFGLASAVDRLEHLLRAALEER